MLAMRGSLAIFLGCISLVGCSGNFISSQSQISGQPVTAPLGRVQHSNPFAQLFVANELGNDVTMYAGGRKKLTKTFTPATFDPVALAADSIGNVYVADCPYYYFSYDNFINVYSKDGKQWGKITQGTGTARALAVDSQNNLYVANWSPYSTSRGWVSVYTPARQWTLEITNDIYFPISLATDRNNDVFVGNSGWISEYPYGAKKPTRVIGNGNLTPISLVVDANGNLYVGIDGNPNEVQVYAPGSTSPSEVITQGINDPVAMAVDSEGSLYVANYAANDVTVYPTGETSASATISDKVSSPDAVLLDEKENVYVANAPSHPVSGSISVYAHGSHALIRRITDGIDQPFAMAFGP
jgi:sugar lactone lactonase YvrE